MLVQCQCPIDSLECFVKAPFRPQKRPKWGRVEIRPSSPGRPLSAYVAPSSLPSGKGISSSNWEKCFWAKALGPQAIQHCRER